MVFENTKLLLRLLWQPAAAMSGILDRGSLLFASLAVLAVSLLFEVTVSPPVPPQSITMTQAVPEQGELPFPVAPARPRWSFSFYTPLLLLAAIYVPGTLLVTGLIGRLGGLGMVFQRDYSPLLTCTSMAWTAAQVPVVLAGWVAPFPVLGVVAALAYVYFAVLMFFVVRTVFGVENGVAAGAVSLSWVPLAVAFLFWGPIRFLFSWLASPFFLFFAFYFLRGEFANVGAGLRSRQSFRRMLETAAINPHDAEAQYQLGLIYQQRRQTSEAIRRFQNAVAIDPSETDAHFQLGRIARGEGRLKDALAHFQTVLDQDEKFSLSVILRELGAVYLANRQYREASHELAVYVERWPYDTEGLFYYGQALEGLGDIGAARAMYARAVESARTAPRYRRRFIARWSRLAQKHLRKLG
ncbi:MAG: tetratricopeptide repeat protein [Bryobacteraceae bacterium]